MNNILITDAVVIPMYELSGRKSFRGTVGIEGGEIALIELSEAAGKAVEEFRKKHSGAIIEIDGRGMAVMPGLVNTHGHVSMTLMRSYADDIPLMPWLNEHIWPFEAKMSAADMCLGAELGIAEMLLGGTTCFMDMYFNETELAETVGQWGIRAVMSTSLLSFNREKFEKDFLALIERYPAGNKGLISVMVAPHSPYTCTDDDLKYVREMASKYGVGLHIHVAETRDELKIVKDKSGLSPVQYLDRLGVLDSSTVAAHCVYLDDRDIETLAARGVSVAHNPQSNMKLASGIAPVAKMMEKGVNVSIGTDGPSSNNDLDMWEELRSASFLQKVATEDTCVIPAWEALRMATVNGAKALGLSDRIGQLKVGMQADIIMVDLQKPHLQPQTDVVANLAYCAKGSDVDTVIVDGKILVRSGKLLGRDLPSLYERVAKRVYEISGRKAQ